MTQKWNDVNDFWVSFHQNRIILGAWIRNGSQYFRMIGGVRAGGEKPPVT